MLLLIIVLILLFGGGGWYGYRQGWYAGPQFGGGLIGLILIVILVLWLVGRL